MDLNERNTELRDFFNEKASGYDDVHAALMATKLAAADALPEGSLRVLDLGAGTGMELFRVFERFPNARVTTLDIAEETAKYLAARPFADRLDILVGDFFTADPGEGYDAVLSTSALHHFTAEDKLRLYRRVFAWLRPGGVFVNCDKVARDEAEEALRLKDYAARTYRHNDTPLTAEHELSAMRAAGFADIRAEDVPGTGYLCARGTRPAE